MSEFRSQTSFPSTIFACQRSVRLMSRAFMKVLQLHLLPVICALDRTLRRAPPSLHQSCCYGLSMVRCSRKIWFCWYWFCSWIHQELGSPSAFMTLSLVSVTPMVGETEIVPFSTAIASYVNSIERWRNRQSRSRCQYPNLQYDASKVSLDEGEILNRFHTYRCSAFDNVPLSQA